MSAKTFRPFKIDIYGLQDAYIGTLQSYEDNFIGQVENPSVKISSDGSQSFTCSIPKYCIDPTTNEKVLNPRWGDMENGVLAENTRVLKVFIMFENAVKVYPFIIDKIVDKRNKSHQVFKEITGSGLAFAELGKQGYKLELKQELVEEELEDNPDLLMTVQYWLDKVFPSVKDDNGKITSWKTPWCYEVKMDWSLYSDFDRESNKVYEDSYVSNWETDGKTLTPAGFSQGREKSRAIDCYNSNKYNITQTIAETFEIFCEYEYKCDAAGRFIGTYTDDDGNVWTGRKVVFYNRAISTENPLHIYYQKNLASMSRTADSSNVYTKLFVKPVESSVMENGYVTIADTLANPTLDDFILNFDYMKSVGSMTDYQMEYTKTYQAAIRKINLSLMYAAPVLNDYVVQINNQKAEKSGIDKQIASAKEQLTYYERLRDNELTNSVIVKDSSNAASAIFTQDGTTYSAALRFEGIVLGTMKGYSDSSYANQIFSADTLKVVYSIDEATGDGYYVVLDEYGYPSAICCKAPAASIIYLALEYSPKNKYEAICQSFTATIDQNTTRLKVLEAEIERLTNEYNDQLAAYNTLLAEKDTLNLELERVLGPALREGYWTPDSYEDRGQSFTYTHSGTIPVGINEAATGLYFDTEAFDNEQLAYYYVGTTKKYYPYIKISSLMSKWKTHELDNLVIHLQRDFVGTAQSSTQVAAGNYYFLCNSKKYYFTLSSKMTTGETLTISMKGDSVSLKRGTTTLALSSYLPNASNMTSFFEGATENLVDYYLYNNAGFIFTYLNIGGAATPVLLFNNSTLASVYDDYSRLAYSFVGESGITSISGYLTTNSGYEVLYPRFYIAEDNVFSVADLLTLKLGDVELEKYYDYSTLLRNGKTLITLKATSNNPIWDFTSTYNLTYYQSQANESLYLDARQVAKDNSYPKYSYDLSVNILPSDNGKIPMVELSQLAYISDPILGVRAASGYISEITFDLVSPQKDSIKIQNYKTKFEDLFSTITASSEAMKNNKTSYDIAASSFGTDGSISGDVIQTAINNNNFWFNYSATGVEISPTDGIVLTNKKPYANGVYGQVVLQGGGIFLSCEIDSNGNRIWNTGITPQGINANIINAGQLNTNLIKIYAGDEMAFQWNSEGLYAYKFDENGLAMSNEYIRYSQEGLHYIRETINDDGTQGNPLKIVSLDWNGLTLRNNNGDRTMYLDAESGDLNLSGTLKSFNYSPGILGSGWLIDQDGYAEFNDIMVRGTISASVFKYDETTAVGGSVYIAPTLIFDQGQEKSLSWAGDGQPVVFRVDSPFKSSIDLAGRTWAVGDVVGVNGVIQLKDDVETRYEIKNLRAKITSMDSDGMLVLQSEAKIYGITQNIFYDKNGEITPMSEVSAYGFSNFVGVESWHFIFLGTNGKRQGILLTAMDRYSPYIDVYDDQAQDTSLAYGAAPRVRLGRLDGLQDITTVTDQYPDISGYGLYSDNVYLTGAIYATYGKIGGLTITKDSLGTSGLTISSEGIKVSSTGAFVVDTKNFSIDKDGNVSMTGTVNATGGKIGSLTIENINNAIGASTSGEVYIKDGVVKADSIVTGAITTDKIAVNAITAEKVAANAITTDKIAANAITSAQIAANTITAADIASGTITSTQIAANTITVNNVVSDFGKTLNIGSNESITLLVSNDEGFKNGTIPVASLKTSYITIANSGITIASGGNINIAAGGTFTIDSDNFKIDSSGNVSVKGTITATGGQIGGWTIGTDKLYAGSGSNYVGISTNSSEYAFWAGASNGTTASSTAPFRVTRDGAVYLGSLYYTDENGANPQKASLTTSLWKYNTAYNNMITEVSATTSSSSVTLTFTRKYGDALTVNFSKALGGVSIIPTGAGSGTNFTLTAYQGYQSSSTYEAKLATIQVWGVLSDAPYSASSSVSLRAGASTTSASDVYATIPVGDVYTSGYSKGWTAAYNKCSFSASGSTPGYTWTFVGPSVSKDASVTGSLVSSLDTSNKLVKISATGAYGATTIQGRAWNIDCTDIYTAGGVLSGGTWSNGSATVTSAGGGSKTLSIPALSWSNDSYRSISGGYAIKAYVKHGTWSNSSDIIVTDVYNAGYSAGQSAIALSSSSWSSGNRTVYAKDGDTTIASLSISMPSTATYTWSNPAAGSMTCSTTVGGKTYSSSHSITYSNLGLTRLSSSAKTLYDANGDIVGTYVWYHS